MEKNGTRTSGATLIECVVSIGALAVALPLVYSAIAEAAKAGAAAEAETRSTWIISACMEEVLASREGRPSYFPATRPGQEFPASGSAWTLAFSPEGRLVGKIPRSAYQAGVREFEGSEIRYLVSMNAEQETPESVNEEMLGLELSMEYPAAVSAGKRKQLNFYTKIR